MLVSAIVVLRIGSCLLFELSTIDMAESSMVSPNSQWAAREWRMIWRLSNWAWEEGRQKGLPLCSGADGR